MKFVNFNRLLQKELLGIADSTIYVVKKQISALPSKTNEVLTELVDWQYKFRVHVNNSKKSPITSKINKLNLRRKEIIKNIFRVIKTYANGLNDNKKTEAELLQYIFLPFKGFSRMSIDVTTASVRTLIGYIKDQPKALNAMKVLDIDDLLIMLENANEALDELYLQRVSDNSDKMRYPEAQKALILANNNLLKSLDSAFFMENNAVAEKIMHDLSNIHTDYHIAIAKRTKTKNNENKPIADKLNLVNINAKSTSDSDYTHYNLNNNNIKDHNQKDSEN